MIRLKTAVLLGGALKLGAILGGASKQDAELLYQFGENVGVAFQLHDDILDVYADPKKFGKQIGGDILANKKTFLLLKAIELAQGEDKAILDKWLPTKYINIKEKLFQVKRVYDNLEIDKIAKAKMDEYLQKALNYFDQVGVSEESKTSLLILTNQLITREY